jgi:desulfoferrodoxin (superoxide reductase-like protein)
MATKEKDIEKKRKIRKRNEKRTEMKRNENKQEKDTWPLIGTAKAQNVMRVEVTTGHRAHSHHKLTCFAVEHYKRRQKD